MHLRVVTTGVPLWTFALAAQWTVPETAIRYWGRQESAGPPEAYWPPNAEHAEVYPLTVGMKNQLELGFYFVDSGLKNISVTANINMLWTITRTAQINVSRPDFDVFTDTGDVQLVGDGRNVKYGDGLAQVGMAFYAQEGANAPAPGTASWLQIINNGEITAKDLDGMSWRLSIQDKLDNGSLPYPRVITTSGLVHTTDSPGVPLILNSAIFGQVYFDEITLRDEFSMYLMWMSNRPHSINVPIQRVDWFWEFYAFSTNVGLDWTLFSWDRDSPEPVGVDTTEYPIWNGSFYNTSEWVWPDF